MSKKIRPKIRYYDSVFCPSFFNSVGIERSKDIVRELFRMNYNIKYYKLLGYSIYENLDGKIVVSLKLEKLQNLKSYAKE